LTRRDLEGQERSLGDGKRDFAQCWVSSPPFESNSLYYTTVVGLRHPVTPSSLLLRLARVEPVLAQKALAGDQLGRSGRANVDRLEKQGVLQNVVAYGLGKIRGNRDTVKAQLI